MAKTVSNVLHRIKAFLYDNVLTKDKPHDYIARVSSERSLGVREICESAVMRGGADVSVATMEHSVNLWLTEMGYQLCDGYSVATDYFIAAPHIRGGFDSPNEKFDREKHRLLFELQQGAELRKEAGLVEVEILGLADVGLHILQVTDIKSGTIDDLLTPGYNLRIAGYKLKVVGDKPGVGIRFINEDGSGVTDVPASDIVVNNPSELIIVIPGLTQGAYKLEITTQFTGNSTLLKEPRTCLFNSILTVE
jgi:hypothetical protein